MGVILVTLVTVLVYNLQNFVGSNGEGSVFIHGTATFYKPPYNPSACYGNDDFGPFVASASNAIWKNGEGCGESYLIKCLRQTNSTSNPCKDDTVFVLIVDHCATEGCGTINLSQEAFNQIANLDAGRIYIEYIPQEEED